MQRSLTSRYSDPYGRYYTHDGVARLLVSSMGTMPTGLVIELGAGNGALVGEASLHWKAAQFVTVDIDKAAGHSTLPRFSKAAVSHHVADALGPRLDQKIGLTIGTVQSALCNPPYITPKWRKHFGQILEDAGLSGVHPQISSVPADILFIAQNLRFLRPGGKLGLILPDGIIAGERCSRLRRALATAHHLERVIELPRRAFLGTEAKAYIVVLTKHGTPTDSIGMQRLNGDGALTEVVQVPVERAMTRLDYSFHCTLSATQREARQRVRLRDLTASIARGSFSSSERKACGFPIFHTTDFAAGAGKVPRAFQMSKARAVECDGAIAQPGDILVARVGRNLETKLSVVERGFVAYSDCVLRIRLDAQYQEQVARFLASGAGQDALRAASHGVGAKFITVDALLDVKVHDFKV